MEDSSVTSEESDKMKLFLVLVLATVAICQPRKKSLPAEPYKHVDSLADDIDRRPAKALDDMTIVPDADTMKNGKVRPPRKLSVPPKYPQAPVVPYKHIDEEMKLLPDGRKVDEIAHKAKKARQLPGDEVEISYKKGKGRTARQQLPQIPCDKRSLVC